MTSAEKIHVVTLTTEQLQTLKYLCSDRITSDGLDDSDKLRVVRAELALLRSKS